MAKNFEKKIAYDKFLHSEGKRLGVKLLPARGRRRKETWNSLSYQARVLEKLKEEKVKVPSYKPPKKPSRKPSPSPKPKTISKSQQIYSEAKLLGFQKEKGVTWNSKLNIQLAQDFISSFNKRKQDKESLINFITSPPPQKSEFIIPDSIDLQDLLDILTSYDFSLNHRFYFGYQSDNGMKTTKPSQTFIEKLKEKVLKYKDSDIISGIEQESQKGSDSEFILNFLNPNRRFIIESTPISRDMPSGAFFRYFLNPEYYNVFKYQNPKSEEEGEECEVDLLQRYQIYTKEDRRWEEQSENCLGFSIKLLEEEEKIPEGTYQKFISWFLSNKTVNIGGKIKTNCLSKLGKILGVYFKITSLNEKGARVNDFYPNHKNRKDIPLIELGRLDGHFFVNEKIDYSICAVNNYHLHNLKNWKYSLRPREHSPSPKNPNGYISLDKYTPNSNISFADSFDLINSLLKNNNKHPIITPMTYSELEKCNEIAKGFTSRCEKEIRSRPPIFSDNDFHEHPTFTEENLNEYLGPSPPFGYSQKYKNGKTTGEYNLNPDGTRRIKEYKTFFFDFETTTENQHIPFLLRSKKLGEEYITEYWGEDCAKQFLDNLPPPGPTYGSRVLLLAHNLGYDISFLFRVDGLEFKNIIRCSLSKVKSASAEYNGIKILFKDTLALTGLSLAKFPRAFGIKGIKKEVMPYGAYTQNSVRKTKITLHKCLINLKNDKDRNTFIQNCKDLYCFTNRSGELESNKETKYILHMKYVSWYCEQDISVLEKGIVILRKEFSEMFDLDLFNFVSIPQMAEAAAHKAGVFKGVYKLSGIAREFINQCIYGGRVMTAKNEKIHVNRVGIYEKRERERGYPKKKKTPKIIQDFDGVSLYPSAMARHDMSVPLGKPILLTNLDSEKIKDLEKYTSYYVKVIIHLIRKDRDFPLLSYKTEEGVREYDNNIVGEHFLSKPHLEDVINFHELKDEDYTIKYGYFFENGNNEKLKEWIVELFNERKKYKDEGTPNFNPAKSELLKMVMNSFYGKTIMAPIDENTQFFYSEEKRDAYANRHYNNIIEITDVYDGEKYKLSFIKSSKPVYSHTTFAQVGANILAISKRIMNEVMCLAEDNKDENGDDAKIDIWYQDTDSMHIDGDKIAMLAEKYKKKYGRELVGKELNQFHVDFNFEGYKVFHSVELIALGKKCYVDKVLCQKYIETDEIDEYGDKKLLKDEKGKPVPDGVDVFKYHIRMKGIPNASILKKCETLGLADVMELYSNLHHHARSVSILETERKRGRKGERKLGYYFDLLAGGRPSFKHSPDFTVTSEKKQERFISFG